MATTGLAVKVCCQGEQLRLGAGPALGAHVACPHPPPGAPAAKHPGL